ncbi:MAG: ATP-binding cassette domain-containing protein [Mesorhizobium sp.]|uniref:sugar ABC transporter ATP-binding protein n=2 Tax=Mesorhizobium sp. TaxID=1871066 RepID=UPI000FE2FEB0|nr:sugar ABC transporter ATP-binding protein [Mesorhizobium sp.]RWH67345.1 MAG: sugar ABC transporter ATP-binding protein [Mesorhizobium sp.]RWL23324.1 MAG: sugar ABC transporter ATP-binding protein [Mesorhizobium sp.]RWL25932.1 MAG: sugar ABC transporter ATP-binding protein [Mesorhizobium sp.]RWL32756.1 MAG: sugar ABC transporter ATP-binding protein [Mesorhizobium sp.]RWL52292.1 MAG: sugar ABC transporter ATP-binding protein [Mesorhizobium sp.]
MKDAVLEMRGIHKRFPGVYALNDVSFAVSKGSVHGVIGENGAGKSTLMRVLSGAFLANEGEVVIDGTVVPTPTPERMLELGIAVIYQELAQAPHLTVAENIFLGRLPKTVLGTVDWRKTQAAAREVLDRLGFRVDPAARIDAISVAQRQMVEIAKAIAREARIVVLDEPSAVLGDAELEHLFATIRRLSAEQGVSFIYITHRLKELYQICDEVTVLRDGQVVASMPLAQTTTADLIRHMVGRELKDVFPPRPKPGPDVRLEVCNISRAGVLRDISFDVRQGEIVGICGLAGAGRTEVLRAIAGADAIDSGEIRIDGKAIAVDGPRAALAHGIGLLPEDRKTEGLFLEQSVAFNVTVSELTAIVQGGLISRRREQEQVSRFIRQMRIKTTSASAKVRTLSGGNQQKCGIARQLHAGTEILLVDEPTRGVDVAAKREIYDLLVELTSTRGAAVVMVSSELPEILGLCNRIVVMREGAVSAVLNGENATEEIIMAHAVWQ